MPIPSVPATFTLSTNPVPGYDEQACTFAIPAGVWTNATWRTEGIGALFPSQSVMTLSGTVALGTASGSYSLSAAANAGQLADINAAAGGNLSATLRDALGSFGDDDVSSFTLELVGEECGYSISPSSASFGAAGGSGSIVVTVT